MIRLVAQSELTPSRMSTSRAVFELARQNLASLGIDSDADLDLYTAVVGGLVDAQHANDAGGDRYSRLLDRAIQMYADHVGL